MTKKGKKGQRLKEQRKTTWSLTKEVTYRIITQIIREPLTKKRLFWEVKNRLAPRKSREELYKYWKKPYGLNLPEDYLKVKDLRTVFLTRLVEKYADHQANILEIGCNVGRNLNSLLLSGFKHLHGIEINKNALELMKKAYPELARIGTYFNAPVETVIKDLDDDSYDVVFTMAVLEHIHPSSSFVFKEMVRITRRYIITIKGERNIS